MPVTHTNRAIAAFKRAFGHGPKSETDQAWISGWIVGARAQLPSHAAAAGQSPQRRATTQR